MCEGIVRSDVDPYRMAAVVAAIIATFLAGGIALYRERRLELANLLVAARVVSISLATSAQVLELLVQGGQEQVDLLSEVPAIDQFPAVWAEHRTALARHLTGDQWEGLVDAAERLQMVSWAARSPGSNAINAAAMRTAAKLLRLADSVLRAYGKRAGVWRNPGRKTHAPPGGGPGNRS